MPEEVLWLDNACEEAASEDAELPQPAAESANSSAIMPQAKRFFICMKSIIFSFLYRQKGDYIGRCPAMKSIIQKLSEKKQALSAGIRGLSAAYK
jgi:hypothetical protein